MVSACFLPASTFECGMPTSQPPCLSIPCRYLPPELLRGELGQLHKADMFALGASLLELATRTELPTGGQQYQDLRTGKLPLLPTFTQRFTAMLK